MSTFPAHPSVGLQSILALLIIITMDYRIYCYENKNIVFNNKYCIITTFENKKVIFTNEYFKNTDKYMYEYKYKSNINSDYILLEAISHQPDMRSSSYIIFNLNTGQFIRSIELPISSEDNKYIVSFRICLGIPCSSWLVINELGKSTIKKVYEYEGSEYAAINIKWIDKTTLQYQKVNMEDYKKIISNESNKINIGEKIIYKILKKNAAQQAGGAEK